MVRCRGRMFRRSKFGVFVSLLVAFVFVSMFLDCSCWRDRMRPVRVDVTHHELARNDANVSRTLWEERNQTEKSNDQREPPIEDPISVTNMGNVSEDVIGSLTPQPRPMRTTEPVEEKGSELLSCKEISEIRITRPLGQGYTKVVELGWYRNQSVAVKRVKSTVKDIKACKTRLESKRWHECYLFANYKIMKEILLQKQLRHPNIIKLLGYCIRSENIADRLSEHGVVAVTEVGRLFDSKRVRHLTWKKRLEIAIDVASLLDYMERSPLGSLILADFKASQFVWVGDKVKLADMDDVSSVEQTCAVGSDCGKGMHVDNVTPCVDGVCRGLNAKHNMNGAYRHIFQYILVHDGDEILSLREEMRRLSVNAATLQSRLQQLLLLENQRPLSEL